MSMWKHINPRAVQKFPRHLKRSKFCYYAREFIKEGWQASDDNDLIMNFKKSPNSKGQQYKERAVRQFIDEVCTLKLLSGVKCMFSWIPSSKCKTDNDYDNRMERVCSGVSERLCTPYSEVFYLNSTVIASHHGGTRDPQFFFNTYQMTDIDLSELDFVVMIDDVVTSGAHFRACEDRISVVFPSVCVIGLFWALTTYR